MFFSRANPAIPTAGMLGISKFDILVLIPSHHIPKTLRFTEDTDFDEIISSMESARLEFPVFVKPDLGERGRRVERLINPEELERYCQRANFDIMVQQCVELPNELSIFVYRDPISGVSNIASICTKQKLTVTGDGASTILELVARKPRARFQRKRLIKKWGVKLNDVPASGELIILESIGNHNKGSKFLDGKHLITSELTEVFDKLISAMGQIYYGRFDLLYGTLEDLNKGLNFKIVEFNGVASEPIHIYDPKHSLIFAYREVFRHWKIMFKICKSLKRRGVGRMKLGEGLKYFKKFRDQQRRLAG